MTRFLVTLGLVAAAALSWAALAGGAAHGYKTRITIKQTDETTYKGRVFSKRDACVREREIEIWHQIAGQNELIDTFNADEHGRWSYTILGSQFYVIAKRSKFGPKGHVCREDRSKTA